MPVLYRYRNDTGTGTGPVLESIGFVSDLCRFRVGLHIWADIGPVPVSRYLPALAGTMPVPERYRLSVGLVSLIFYFFPKFQKQFWKNKDQISMKIHKIPFL